MCNLIYYYSTYYIYSTDWYVLVLASKVVGRCMALLFRHPMIVARSVHETGRDRSRNNTGRTCGGAARTHRTCPLPSTRASFVSKKAASIGVTMRRGDTGYMDFFFIIRPTKKIIKYNELGVS
jgi:hypothetical protein